jgi:hypothetical protein
MGGIVARALTAANERQIVHAFRKLRALDGSLARPLRELGLSDSRTLREMVVSTVICRAGPQRYFLDEKVWAHRRQLPWRPVARTLVVLAIVGAAAALYLHGR